MILILTQCFPSQLGGIESLVSNLALGLSKSEKVIVLADRHQVSYDAVFDNCHKDKILVRRFGGIKFFRRRKKNKEIKSFIESQKISLVIADSWKSLEFSIDYLNIKKVPTVCLAHGNEFLSKKQSKIDRISNTIRQSSLVVANSQFTKKLVESFNIPNIKIEYIYPGALDLRKIIPLEVAIRSGGPVLTTLARIEKRKGHAYVIETIKKLIIKYPNLNYIVAGEGKEKRSLQKLVLVNNLTSNVNFVGSINDNQKKYLFQKTDLMIMPTLDESTNNSIEGFGISYVEAAFFAIPSVASNIGGTSEAVLNNSTGIVIDKIDELYDSILDLLDNKEKRNNLGKAAQQRAIESFQWDIVTDKHISVYKKLILNY